MSTSALSLGQKVLNQRLLAEHCWSEAQAQAVYEELQQTYENDAVVNPNHSLMECMKSCNEQLRFLGLEIIVVAMPVAQPTLSSSSSQTSNEENEDQESGGGGNQKKQPTGTRTARHYCMVNKFPDGMAKQAWQAALFPQPAQQAFVKAVLAHLVAATTTPTTTSPQHQHDRPAVAAAASRSTLINLRTTPAAADASAPSILSLPLAEDTIDRMIAEQWIVLSSTVSSSSRASLSNRASANTMEEHDDEENDSPPKSVRQRGRSSIGGGGGNNRFVLGPRAFGELSYFLTEELGLDPQDLPVQIVL